MTRELWQSEKDASIIREGLLRDQIITLEKSLLTMTPIAVSDKTHADMMGRMESQITAAAKVLENKIGVNDEKIADLKTYQASTQGRSAGYSATYGWAVAGISVVVAVIILVNTLFAR